MTLHRIAYMVVLATATLSAGAQEAGRKPYIVQLADAPAAAYAGGVSGYSATRPAPGSRFNIDASSVRAYIGYLDARRNQALAAVAQARVLHRYNVAFNGFSALMTDAEAQKLRGTPGVVAVTADTPRSLDTSRTPAFLGLSTPGGLWSRTDAAARAVKGEDIIIGVVDSGVWPENLSFSDKVDGSGKPVASSSQGSVAYGPPPARWKGRCQSGPGFTTAHCNHKLIGAQYFNQAFLSTGRQLHWSDWVSPRDQDGHGSHVASTAGGNAGVDTVINGAFGGTIAGMAPRARIAAYKVCWTWHDPSTQEVDNNCWNGDSVAAIDKAVADGVDVINFSISGSRTSFLDPVEVAFFNASAAGIFVAAAAGNDGPANTVAHISPWLTTVAASTHDRLTVATLNLGNGSSHTGPSRSNGLSAHGLVLSTAVALKPPFDDSNTDARLCVLGSLDPAKAAGKVVVCDRGSNARVEKSQEVKRAGGLGMVLLNVDPGDQIDDAHYVPTVHLGDSVRAAVRSYAAAQGATAALGASRQAPGVVAPVMADFSSRGPNLGNANLLKPDIAAPGVNVLAGHTYKPATAAERDAIAKGTLTPPPASDFLSGTSMASPHIAGIAALLKQLHPDWSPAALKSALLTSAQAVKLPDGSRDADVWGYGAGHVNPNAAAATTLVYDAGTTDYVRFLCGVGALDATSPQCATHGAIAAYDLNLPSIAAEVVGRITLRRTVKNLGGAHATYVASANLPGFEVKVEPATLSLAPQQSASFTVQLTRSGAPIGDWRFGSLTWSDGSHQVRSPLVAQALTLSAPALIEDTRPSGTKVFTVGTGYDGALQVTPLGLVPAQRQAGQVTHKATQCFPVSVPAATRYARFALFDSDTSGAGADDLDLQVYQGDQLVGSSGSSSSDEEVTLSEPAAGQYRACVLGYAVQGDSSRFTLSSWVVAPSTGEGTLRAAGPSKIAIGGTASVGLGWSTSTGRRYLGAVLFKDGRGAVVGSTLLSIDTASAAARTVSGAGRKAVPVATR